MLEPARSVERVYRRILRNRPCNLILLGEGAASLGERLLFMIILWLLLDAGSLWLAVALAAATAVPSLAVSAVGPRLLDTAADLRTLAGLDLLCALAIAALALGSGSALPIGGVLGVGLVLGLRNVVARSNVQALVPSLVAPREAGAVIGLLDLVDRLAMVAGPGAAAVLLHVLAPHRLLLADALAYVVSAIALLLLRRRLGPDRDRRATRLEQRAIGRTGRFTALRGRQHLVFGVGIRTLGAVLWPTITLGMPLFVSRELALPMAAYGTVLGIYAIASIGGNVLGVWLGARTTLRRLCGTAWLVTGLAFIALSTATSLTGVAIAYGVAGLAMPLGIVAIGTTIAGLDEEADRADVHTIQRTVLDLGNLIGVIVAGFALAVGGGAAIGFAGGALVLGVLLLLGGWVRAERSPDYPALESRASSSVRSSRSGGVTTAPSRT